MMAYPLYPSNLRLNQMIYYEQGEECREDPKRSSEFGSLMILMKR